MVSLSKEETEAQKGGMTGTQQVCGDTRPHCDLPELKPIDAQGTLPLQLSHGGLLALTEP